MKTFIVDTCVLIDDPECMYKFQDNEVVIPFTVLEELDRHKDKPSSTGEGSRAAIREIYKLSMLGKLVEGVIIEESGTRFRIDITDPATVALPTPLDVTSGDNAILAIAIHNKSQKNETVLITNDINLKVKSETFDIATEKYENRTIKAAEKLFEPFHLLEVEPEDVDLFSSTGWLTPPDNHKLHPNQNILLRVAGSSQSNIGRYHKDSGQIRLLDNGKRQVSGITGKNLGQRFAIDMLMDDSLNLVSLIGKAGTGKTLLALAVGLHKVLREKKYHKIVIARPIVTLDKSHEIGFLPGSMQEKLAPWAKPIMDNLDVILDEEQSAEKLVEEGIIEIEALGYIRGRSITNAFIIIDEAQQLLPREAKAILTRVGEESKIVLTGDPFQIDNRYLDEYTNGLSYTIEKFKSETIAGHTILTKCERSSLSSIAAEIM